MATAISRDILNRETDARFWAQTGHKPGKRLDPSNPLDKAKMPVWMDIFRKVKAEADAGTLVTTYDRAEVSQPLADAAIASTVAAAHVDAAVKAADPTTAKQHADAALTATQVASLKLKEAAKNQPPTVSPRLEEIAAREGARTPPPSYAPAVDHIAHEQMQNNQKTPRERPSRETLNKETNARFWIRTRHKPGQRLDMADPTDREMAKIWKDIFREVEREANEGRLIITTPDLVPRPDEARPPRPPAPAPPRPPAPPRAPVPSPIPPPPRPDMGPPRGPPTGPLMQQPPLRPPMGPPMQPPTGPQMLPGMGLPVVPARAPMQPPWMGPPMQPPWRAPPMRPPLMQQPPMGPMGPMGPMQPPMRPAGAPSIPGAPPKMPPTDISLPAPPTDVTPSTPTEPATEGAPAEGMSTKAKIALGLLGFGTLAAIVYAATRKPSADKTVTFRHTRAAARVAAGGGAPPGGERSFAFPPPRGGRF